MESVVVGILVEGLPTQEKVLGNASFPPGRSCLLLVLQGKYLGLEVEERIEVSTALLETACLKAILAPALSVTI